MRLVRLFVLPLLVGAAAFAQTTPTPTRPGEDAGETTWTVRYANCESGFYVLLPAGVVGHAAKATGPNQGFSVNPAAPASTAAFSASESQRFIEVVSYYDLEGHGESTSVTIDY